MLFNVPASPDNILKNELAAVKYHRQKAIHDNRFYCETHRCTECENPKKADLDVCSEHCGRCKYTGCYARVARPREYCANHGCLEGECLNEAMGGYRTCSSHTPKCSTRLGACNKYLLDDGSIYCSLHECERDGCHRARLVDPEQDQSQWMLQFCKRHHESWIRENRR